jgi:hypothetical protein
MIVGFVYSICFFMIGRLLATERASVRVTPRLMSSRKGVGLIPARKSFLIRLALGPEGTPMGSPSAKAITSLPEQREMAPLPFRVSSS